MLVLVPFELANLIHGVASTAIGNVARIYSLSEDAWPEYILPLHVTCDIPSSDRRQAEPLFNSFLMGRESVHGAHHNGAYWTSELR